MGGQGGVKETGILPFASAWSAGLALHHTGCVFLNSLLYLVHLFPFCRSILREVSLVCKETNIYLKYSNPTGFISVIFFIKIKMSLMCTCLYSVFGRMDTKLMALSLLGRPAGQLSAYAHLNVTRFENVLPTQNSF